MLKDLKSNLWFSRALSPVSVSDNTPLVSQVLDTSGYTGVMAVIQAGALADADATFQVLLEDSDDNSTFNAVDDAYMVGIEGVAATPTGASFRYDSDNAVRTLGYIGPKRYLRLTITPANNASGALISAAWCASGKRSGLSTSQTA